MGEFVAAALSVLQVAGLILVGRGFWPMLRNSDSRQVYHMAWGVVVMVAAISARTIYWDILPVLLQGAWVDGGPLGRSVPNIVFGVMILVSLWHKLRLLLVMIPEEDRGRYSMLSAPFYPRSICIIRLAAALRSAWRQR